MFLPSIFSLLKLNILSFFFLILIFFITNYYYNFYLISSFIVLYCIVIESVFSISF